MNTLDRVQLWLSTVFLSSLMPVIEKSGITMVHMNYTSLYCGTIQTILWYTNCTDSAAHGVKKWMGHALLLLYGVQLHYFED